MAEIQSSFDHAPLLFILDTCVVWCDPAFTHISPLSSLCKAKVTGMLTGLNLSVSQQKQVTYMCRCVGVEARGCRRRRHV